MGGFFFFPAVPYLVAVSSAGHHSVVTFRSWRSWSTLRNLVKTISVCRSVLRLTMRCDINYSPLCIDPIDLTEGNDCMAHISHRVVWAVSSVFRLTQWTNSLTAMLIPNHQGTILRCFSSLHIPTLFYVRLLLCLFSFPSSRIPRFLNPNSLCISCYPIRSFGLRRLKFFSSPVLWPGRFSLLSSVSRFSDGKPILSIRISGTVPLILLFCVILHTPRPYEMKEHVTAVLLSFFKILFNICTIYTISF